MRDLGYTRSSLNRDRNIERALIMSQTCGKLSITEGAMTLASAQIVFLDT